MLENEIEDSEEQTSTDYGFIQISSKRGGIQCYKLRSGQIVC